MKTLFTPHFNQFLLSGKVLGVTSLNAAPLLIFSLVFLLIGIGIGLLINRGKTAGGNENVVAIEKELADLKEAFQLKSGESNTLRTQLAAEQEKARTNDFIETQFKVLKEQVDKFKNEASEAETKRRVAEAELAEKIKVVGENSSALASQTQAIAGALSSSQTRGRFGEAQLEKLLDSAGLVKGVHYFTQQDIADDIHEDNRSLRPDVTIKMPNNREIYIDSKFPFQRFFEAFETEDEEARKKLLSEHTKDFVKHCEDLAKKNYSASKLSPDYVIVFAPIDSIYFEALKSDPEFLNKIYKVGVTVATPTSLFAILRTVGDVFSRYQVAAGAAEIQGLANKFLQDITLLYSRIDTLGNKLNSAVEAYNNVIPTAEKTILRNVNKMRALNVSVNEVEEIQPITTPVRQLQSRIEGNSLELNAGESDEKQDEFYASEVTFE